MADFSDFSLAAQAAQDSSTHPNALSEIAQRYPNLRAAVAANPSTFPELLNWLDAQGDPEVSRVVAWRQANPAPPAGPYTVNTGNPNQTGPAQSGQTAPGQTPQNPTPQGPIQQGPIQQGPQQGFIPQGYQPQPLAGVSGPPVVAGQPVYGAPQPPYGQQAWGPAPTPPKKKGWLIPVIIVGVIVLIGAVYGVVKLVADDPDPTPSPSQSTYTPKPAPTQQTTQSVETNIPVDPVTENADAFDLHVGDCLIAADIDGSFSEIPRVPCTQPHDVEVTAIYDSSLSGNFNEEAIDDEAWDLCEAAIDSYVGPNWWQLDVDWDYFSPTEGSWKSGDREVDCIVRSMSGELDLISSLKDAAQ